MEGIYGLLGKTLAHSYSPQIHSMLGDYDYRLFEMEEQEVEGFIKTGDFSAINVTIPYKKTVMPYLDRIDPEALKIGSVNTVVRESDGSLTGYNTDGYGFAYMLKKGGMELKGKKVLILGSGGASLTARSTAEALGASEIVVVSRSGENNYNNISSHFDADIIINTTPVGMYPHTLVSPVSLEGFTRLCGVADMIYNPKRTALLLEAERRRINCAGGIYMLAAQAKRAAELFFGKVFEDEIIDKIVNELSFELSNIILVGMPGCGKTTVGTALANRLGMMFVDTDELIIAKAGKPIPQIFSEEGEKGFRKIEAEVIREIGKEKGLVIATGGGAVVTEENHDALRQNGRVIFINRNINLLSTEGRPLSKKGSLEEMLTFRLPLYRKICDFEIDGNDTVDRVTERIVKKLK